MIGEAHVANGVLASLVAAGMSTLGLLSMVALGDWGRRNSPYFSAFAIGVLLVATFFHLVPEAIDADSEAWKAIAGSFLIMVAFGMVLRLVTRGDSNARNMAFGFAAIIPLGFHSAVDGLVYEASFHSDWFTGVMSTLGLLLHEFPEGVIAYFLVLESGASRRWAAIVAFLASSVTTVMAAFGAALFIDSSSTLPVAPLLGGTAGALLYIIVFHLGIHASAAPNRDGYAWASLGAAIATASIVIRMIFMPH